MLNFPPGSGSVTHLTSCPHICWEELAREEERQGLDPQLDGDDEEAGGEEAGHLEAEHVLHQPLPAGDEVGEGGEEEEAEDGEDEGGEVHGPPGEGHQYPGQAEGGEQSATRVSLKSLSSLHPA